MLVQVLSESHARRIGYSLDHRIQRPLGKANRPHAVVNAPGSRNTPNNQETRVIRGYGRPLTRDGLG